jgi:hypothetical protein
MEEVAFSQTQTTKRICRSDSLWSLIVEVDEGDDDQNDEKKKRKNIEKGKKNNREKVKMKAKRGSERKPPTPS